ncbi:MAG TPA: hypothetical protein VKX16_19435 [Chloroflexota bacterium]|nr:hypothetical protein [Chloroflexota bacterium]
MPYLRQLVILGLIAAASIFAVGRTFANTGRGWPVPTPPPRPVPAPPRPNVPAAPAPAMSQPMRVQNGSIPSPVGNCPFTITNPIGQANPSQEPEPMYPIECAPEPMNAEPTTRISGANSWVDDFQTGVPMGNLEDGNMGYRVFRAMTYQKGPFTRARLACSGTFSCDQLFVNNNHWMDDEQVGFGFGAAISPNRSFLPVNHEFVFDSDVAAGITDYQPVDAHTELAISTAAVPTGGTNVQGDLGGQFKGAWTLFCPLSPQVGADCQLMAPTEYPVGSHHYIRWTYSGVWQYSVKMWGDDPGVKVWVNGKLYHLSDFFRRCAHNQMDMYCRDRFRIDMTPSQLSVYVNGQLFLQATATANTQIADLPKGQLFPTQMLDGSTPLYTYVGDWMGSGAEHHPGLFVRYHFQHIAVNPGTPPSASPSFCLGDPGNTCPM